MSTSLFAPPVMVALLSLQCGGESPRGADVPALAAAAETAKLPASPETTPAAAAKAQAAVKPPPPPGVLLPLVGRPRQIHAGDARTAYTWKKVFEVDPSDPAVLAALASESATPGWDAGDAALHLYEEQVEASGAKLTRGPGLSMYYDLEGLVVFANSGPQFHLRDPTGFTISVGPAGG